MTKSPFYPQIIEVSLHSFQINEYNLQRELFNFFKSLFVSALKNKGDLLEQYMKVFFAVFPEMSTSHILKAVEVIQTAYEYVQESLVTTLILNNLA